MIRRILLMALAGATLLLAADPTGTWTGDQPGRDGNTYNITFKLKADGGKLTGTMGGDSSSSRSRTVKSTATTFRLRSTWSSETVSI